MRKESNSKNKIKALVGLVTIFVSKSIFAVGIETTKAIGSVQPGVISSQMQQTSNEPSQETSPVSAPKEEKANPLGEQANKIKFKLTKIILEDNHVYSDQVLEALYKDKLNKVITVAQLQGIMQDITNYYRNNGYILSRAIIPPQHVANGVVKIRVIEGYINKTDVIGKPRGAKPLLAAYAQHIADQKPTRISTLEQYLLLANEVPGVQVKGILEPSKTQVGASDLSLGTETKLLGGYLSYDNYGTRYIGPQQVSANAQTFSIFRPGDLTSITYVGTPKGNELQYKDIMHDTPLGTHGWRLALDVNQAATNPLYLLRELKIAGVAQNYSATVRYPVIRSRAKNLTLEAGLYSLDSYTTQLDLPLYADHVRALRVGATYDFADRFKGSNLLGADIVRGLDIAGATTDSQSFFTSRYGATSRYTKVRAQASRIQALFGRFSAFGLLKGQYSFQPLLASEQFAYGGSQLGRGYDPAEIIGDRGAAASIELRLDTAPQKFHIQTVQYYAFYDAGIVWNLRNVQGTPTKQDATSTGLGARIYMTKYLSGNFMITQPLSRQVQALEPINESKRPRAYFSITAVL